MAARVLRAETAAIAAVAAAFASAARYNGITDGESTAKRLPEGLAAN
jgi:hypothetical protein